MTIVLIIAVICLAYSNGANDNFKGVATLYGSGAASFERARLWATTTTIAGSLLSIFLAASLAKRFTGNGLVPTEIANSSELLVSVGAAGAMTILLATIVGMPTSTTHALTGALTGIALLVSGGQWSTIPFARLWSSFFMPLLLSPLLAFVFAGIAYVILRKIRIAMGVTRHTCVCIGPKKEPVPIFASVSSSDFREVSHYSALDPDKKMEHLSMAIGESPECVERYQGRVAGVNAQSAVETMHYASAGAVCFARAVNDTPKIAALLMIGGSIGVWKLGIVAAAMAIGGVIQSRKVAETMSNGITKLNPGQGLTGNLVTAMLVIGASRFGVPVSTTHVSVGSIFGIGVAGGKPHWSTVGKIGTTWLTTLPLGALLGAGIYYVLTHAPAATTLAVVGQ